MQTIQIAGPIECPQEARHSRRVQLFSTPLPGLGVHIVPHLSSSLFSINPSAYSHLPRNGIWFPTGLSEPCRMTAKFYRWLSPPVQWWHPRALSVHCGLFRTTAALHIRKEHHFWDSLIASPLSKGNNSLVHIEFYQWLKMKENWHTNEFFA